MKQKEVIEPRDGILSNCKWLFVTNSNKSNSPETISYILNIFDINESKIIVTG